MGGRFFALAAAALVAACAGGNRPTDVVPVSKEVRTQAPAAAVDAGTSPYEHVSRRPRATVALAEARDIPHDEAVRMIEDLASWVARCMADLERQGELVEGAGRIVVVAGPRGGVGGVQARLAPGDDVARNALVCIAPAVKLLPLPLPRAGQRVGMAIELTWGPAGASGAPAAAPDEAREAPREATPDASAPADGRQAQ